MSGPFGSPQWMYSSGFYPHEIGNSARLDSNSYYTRTPSSAGNRKTWTWSGWVKRSSSGTRQCLFGSVTPPYGGSDSTTLQFGFLSTDEFQLGLQSVYLLVSTQKFRDFGAWYHIVVRVDTTQATANNRVRVYINGEQITDFGTNNIGSTYAPQNGDLGINNNQNHDIGQFLSGNYFNGYIAEVNHVDGSSLAPTSFGETKADTWIPKKYTGSYGTNGYYLDFATRATDPIDASGQGNNWTDTNVVATDWMLDSPTNNFATLNPLAQFGSPPISEGNLKVEQANGSDGVFASIQPTGDKYYWEALLSSGIQGYGVMANSGNAYNALNTLYYTDGRIYVDNSLVTSSATTATSGDIIGIEYDPTAETIKFFKNNTQIGSTYDATGDGLLPVTTGTGAGSGVSIFNFGQDSSFAGNKTAQGNTDANGRGDFYYAPPAGYLALCTANLPDPVTAINPAVNNSPQDYFNTVLYTGNGGTQSITGVGFQPDWVWQKSRSASGIHNLFDVVRGANKYLSSNNNASEATPASNNRITSIDADGFSLGNSSNTNDSGETYVAWNWKAGGSAVANTDGTIASQVSVNTDAGFSIITYTGNNTNAATVGHGLGKTPAFLITKSRDTSTSPAWHTSHKSLAANYDVALDSDSAAWNPGGNGWHELTSASVFTLKNGTTDGTNVNQSGDAYVAYCFAEVEGFSKFGSYTGNGSADGPFIYTGFRPAFLLVKSATSAADWVIYDSARETFNTVDQYLIPNKSNAEASPSAEAFDLTSNGFKVRGSWSGMNSGTLIYMAFAEMPFKYANAR
jgi:hypothetical protein